MRRPKQQFKTRQEKIDYLNSLKNGSASIDDLIEPDVVFIGEEGRKNYEIVKHKKCYEGRMVFFLPDNGRDKKDELKS